MAFFFVIKIFTYINLFGKILNIEKLFKEER